MNATKTKAGPRPAVEQLPLGLLTPSVTVDGSIVELEPGEDFKFFLVNTDDFMPHVAKDSLLEVFIYQEHTQAERAEDLQRGGAGALALVAGKKGIEVRTAEDCGGAYIVGQVWEVRRWPGKEVKSRL